MAIPEGRGPAIKAFIRPYNYWHDFYSGYYREGLRRYAAEVGGRYEEISMGRSPDLLRTMRRVRDAYRLQPLFNRSKWLSRAYDRTAKRIEGRVQPPAGLFVSGSSYYLVDLPGKGEVKVCINSDDNGHVVHEEIVAWSDVYFKTNYWPTETYPAKVLPFVNADPLVIPQEATFRSYRSLVKQYDICMVVRVWGGKDEVEGVEHNLRLIEAVAKAKGTKFLYAYLVAGDIAGTARRLEKQGIPCGTHPIPAKRLWQASAASRLNVIRLGMHYCVPWRVTGAIAIGSGMVLDRAPLTRWPEPLAAGQNFLALDVETGVDQPLAPEAQYAAIPGKIEAWLAEPDLAARVGRNNGAYFDRHLAPARVGEHFVRTVEKVAASR
jgi:hypothetical protein